MSKSQAFKEKADARFCNRLFVPIFEMKEDGLDRMLKMIEGHRPVLVDGYAEAFDFLARHLAEHGGLEHAPRAVMSSAQETCRSTAAR